MANLEFDLISILKDADLKKFIDAIHHDRVTHEDTTNALLKQYLSSECHGQPTIINGKINTEFIETQPLLYLLHSIANGEDNLEERERAAIAYKNKYNDDNRFEFNYAYFNSPLPLLTHLLIVTKIWDKAFGSDQKKVSYDSEMMGTLLDNVSYKADAKISNQYYQYLKKTNNNLDSKGQQDADGNFIFSDNIFGLRPSKNDLADWLNRMYIPSRRSQQQEVMAIFENKLEATSKKLEQFFNNNKKNVVFLIGPIAGGKSTYADTVLGFQENTGNSVTLSADSLKGLMHTLDFLKPVKAYQYSNSDLHFESCALSKLILPKKDEFKNLFVTGAYIDDRFQQALGWYKDRDILVIEVTPLTPLQAAKQAFRRDKHWQNKDNFNYVINSANTAQQNRQVRIDTAKEQGFHYQLVCNKPSNAQAPDFSLVVEIHNQQIEVKDDPLFQSLTDFNNICSEEKGNHAFNALLFPMARVADLQGVGMSSASLPPDESSMDNRASQLNSSLSP